MLSSAHTRHVLKLCFWVTPPPPPGNSCALQSLKTCNTPMETSVIRGQRTALNDRIAGSTFFPSQLQIQATADLTQLSPGIQMLPRGGVRARRPFLSADRQRKLLLVEKNIEEENERSMLWFMSSHTSQLL